MSFGDLEEIWAGRELSSAAHLAAGRGAEARAGEAEEGWGRGGSLASEAHDSPSVSRPRDHDCPIPTCVTS